MKYNWKYNFQDGWHLAKLSCDKLYPQNCPLFGPSDHIYLDLNMSLPGHLTHVVVVSSVYSCCTQSPQPSPASLRECCQRYGAVSALSCSMSYPWAGLEGLGVWQARSYDVHEACPRVVLKTRITSHEFTLKWNNIWDLFNGFQHEKTKFNS